MSRLATVEIHKEELKFSAGHFMVFSNERRESLHGHDYQVSAAFDTLIQQNGMAFDCREYKDRLATLCQSLDYRFILPSQSTFLRLEDAGNQWLVHINQQVLPFFKTDAVVLPITNATLEELSYWFLQQFTAELQQVAANHILGMTIKVFNGRGESGAARWVAETPSTQ